MGEDCVDCDVCEGTGFCGYGCCGTGTFADHECGDCDGTGKCEDCNATGKIWDRWTEDP